MKTWFSKWKFGLILGLGLVAFEIAAVALLIAGAPQGQRWLGSTIFNTSDQAVYLSYLDQGKDGLLLQNRFNIWPQQPRFDGFWSMAGLLVRIGLSPIVAHELLRIICTLALGFAIYATAKAVTRDEKEARLASVLASGGLAMGWVYDVWMGIGDRWTPHSLATADLASELAVAPVVLGGAHMILSFAIQLIAMRWIWQSIFEEDTRRLPILLILLFWISFFHPYFIPLFALYATLAFAMRQDKNIGTFSTLMKIGLSLVPGAAYYLWVAYRDRAFFQHFALTNRLPLDPWYFWLLILLPFLPAAIWLIRHKLLEKNKVWILIWFSAAAICMLLPFPWTRKYTQALLPALVFLTIPFWSMLAQRISGWIWPLKLCFAILIAFPYIHLFQTQAMMMDNPFWSKSFYAPEEFMRACGYIKDSSPKDAVVLVTDQWANHWIPSCASRRVWLGHAHETPDFPNRIARFNAWKQTGDAGEFMDYLRDIPADLIVSTSEKDTERMIKHAKDNGWRLAYEEGGYSLWERTD